MGAPASHTRAGTADGHDAAVTATARSSVQGAAVVRQDRHRSEQARRERIFLEAVE